MGLAYLCKVVYLGGRKIGTLTCKVRLVFILGLFINGSVTLEGIPGIFSVNQPLQRVIVSLRTLVTGTSTRTYAEEDEGMILEVLPNIFQLFDHLDAQRFELSAITNPRKHQQLRSSDSPSADNHFLVSVSLEIRACGVTSVSAQSVEEKKGDMPA